MWIVFHPTGPTESVLLALDPGSRVPLCPALGKEKRSNSASSQCLRMAVLGVSHRIQLFRLHTGAVLALRQRTLLIELNLINTGPLIFGTGTPTTCTKSILK